MPVKRVTHSFTTLHAVFLQASHIFKASRIAIILNDHHFMDYWEHLAGVSEVSAPSKYTTVVVVGNLADNNCGQIFWVEYLKQISDSWGIDINRPKPVSVPHDLRFLEERCCPLPLY